MSQSGDVYVTKNRSLLANWFHGKSAACDSHHLVFRMADVVQQGYLSKQGSRLKMWTKRYFILRLESHHMTLGYYNSKEDLTLCSETPIGPGHRLHDRSCSRHPFRFELRSGTRSLVLEADSKAQYNDWKLVLEEAIRWNDTMVPAANGNVVKYGRKVTEEVAAKRLAAKKELAATNAAVRPKYLPASREGNQCFMASNTRFDIPLKYKYVKVIGSGAYGVVIAAEDSEDVHKTQLAIKNIQRAFDDLTDAKRIVREIKLMRHLQHKQVLSVIDLLPPVSLDKFEDVYIVSNLMATDLHRVIYSRHALSNEHVAYFMYQMLCGLKYIHSANVIHRDLKPSNILLNGNCELKICDFGLARGFLPEENIELTEYVVTRWYRAPEIMLGCMKYGKQVDTWSLGCMFAEMVSRKPLFPGQDYIDQLHLIMNAIGAPAEEELYFLTNSRAKKFMTTEFHKRGAEPVKPLESLFPEIAPDALDLMRKMLTIDPNKRISVEEALAHPYLASIRTVEDETVADSVFDFEFENDTLEKPALQKLIWDEILLFHPEIKQQEPAAVAEPTNVHVAVPPVAVRHLKPSPQPQEEDLEEDNQAAEGHHVVAKVKPSTTDKVAWNRSSLIASTNIQSGSTIAAETP